MSEELSGNILAIQTGAPTAATNAVLSGFVTEALNHGVVEEVYGTLGGLKGLLNEDFIDLAEESQQAIRGLRHTACAALGTSDYVLSGEADIARALSVLEAHDIRFVVVVGDTATLVSLDALCMAAAAKGYDLRIVGVPHSLENSVVANDHSLGFGSAAKTVATRVKQIAVEQQAQGGSDRVAIVQLDDVKSGWLVAATTLAKQRNRPEDVPHVVLLPEVLFNPQAFLDEVQTALKAQRFCLIVTADRLFDADGNILGADAITGVPQPIGDYLEAFLQEHLGLTSHVYHIGASQRLSGSCFSKADNDEAYLCGETAVKAVVQGKTAQMLTLMPAEGEGATSEVGFVALDQITTQPKPFPEEWVNENAVTLRHQLFKYAMPLIQGETPVPYVDGLPAYVRLVKNRIDRKLEAYNVG